MYVVHIIYYMVVLVHTLCCKMAIPVCWTTKVIIITLPTRACYWWIGMAYYSITIWPYYYIIIAIESQFANPWKHDVIDVQNNNIIIWPCGHNNNNNKNNNNRLDIRNNNQYFKIIPVLQYCNNNTMLVDWVAWTTTSPWKRAVGGQRIFTFWKSINPSLHGTGNTGMEISLEDPQEMVLARHPCVEDVEVNQQVMF